MEYEVIIAGGINPKETKMDISEKGFMITESNYELELYKLNQPLKHKAEYLAVMIKAHFPIQLIVKINQSKSDFEKGLLVPEGKPIKVYIRLKVKDNEVLADQIWYTSFKTLLTHESTDEFVEKKSKHIDL